MGVEVGVGVGVTTGAGAGADDGGGFVTVTVVVDGVVAGVGEVDGVEAFDEEDCVEVGVGDALGRDAEPVAVDAQPPAAHPSTTTSAMSLACICVTFFRCAPVIWLLPLPSPSSARPRLFARLFISAQLLVSE